MSQTIQPRFMMVDRKLVITYFSAVHSGYRCREAAAPIGIVKFFHVISDADSDPVLLSGYNVAERCEKVVRLRPPPLLKKTGSATGSAR
jgi:hypothetical protein